MAANHCGHSQPYTGFSTCKVNFCITNVCRPFFLPTDFVEEKAGLTVRREGFQLNKADLTPLVLIPSDANVQIANRLQVRTTYRIWSAVDWLWLDVEEFSPTALLWCVKAVLTSLVSFSAATPSCTAQTDLIIIVTIPNLYSTIVPLGGYRGDVNLIIADHVKHTQPTTPKSQRIATKVTFFVFRHVTVPSMKREHLFCHKK